MSNPIVTVNVFQIQAPEPNKLQKRGALISQGQTNLSVGQYSLLTQLDDLTDLLAAPLALTTVVWSNTLGGQVTATASAPHGIPINQQFIVTVSGADPAGYNGTYVAFATSSTAFKYYLSADPGSQVTPGTYAQTEIVSMATTFFAQGAQQGVYVLELGAGTVAQGVAALQLFIQSSPQFFYSYLVPRVWDVNNDYLTFLGNYNNTTSKTYFFTTTSVQNMEVYTDLLKCAVVMVEAPSYGVWAANAVTAGSWTTGLASITTTSPHGVKPGQLFTLSGIVPVGYNGRYIALNGTTGSTLVYALADDPGTYGSAGTLQRSYYSYPGVPALQFTTASIFRTTLNYNPTTTNKVPPLAFTYLYGVTVFPIQGNAALISEMNGLSVNYVGVGAEGGISNTIVFNGHTMDGRPFNYWYSVDWMQINVDLAIANAIINGSNTSINPLYYNQIGIDRLQVVAASVGASAITFGLALGKVIQTDLDGPEFDTELDSGKYAGNLVVNAVPFTAYTAANPSAYREGDYGGLSMTFTPLRGFESITFNIAVTDFVAGAR